MAGGFLGLGLALAWGVSGCAEPPPATLELLRKGMTVVETTHPSDAPRPIDNAPGRAGTLSVPTGETDRAGRPIEVGCATCHSLREPPRAGSRPTLKAFHAALELSHGGLDCQACHAAPTYGQFHLADGRTVEPGDEMTLCSQCHGTQRRDYNHGIHGGMTGYWDRSRGERRRNQCTDCHDPHAPAFRAVWPARGPHSPVTKREGGSHGG